jgi:signal transduction histidine kinase
MERIDRLTTLGEVSAGIAHEIRNPLAGIKTSAQVLEESFNPNDHRTQLVRRIVKEIDRSNELLKKFFKFAKPGKPQQRSVDIEALIEGVFIILTSKLRKKKIVLKREYDHNLKHVYVDENQIEQVIFNLLLNAMDAIGEEGEIGIRIYDHPVISDHTDEMVGEDIHDNGCGISGDLLEKIFNPFYTTKNDGVGLGLSISSRLVEENGGHLNVSSEVGKGSVFTIILPGG